MNSGEKKWLDPVRRRPITAHGFRATFRPGRRRSRLFRTPWSSKPSGIRSARRSSELTAGRMSSTSVSCLWRLGRNGPSRMRLDRTTLNVLATGPSRQVEYGEETRFLLIGGSKVRALAPTLVFIGLGDIRVFVARPVRPKGFT